MVARGDTAPSVPVTPADGAIPSPCSNTASSFLPCPAASARRGDACSAPAAAFPCKISRESCSEPDLTPTVRASWGRDRYGRDACPRRRRPGARATGRFPGGTSGRRLRGADRWRILPGGSDPGAAVLTRGRRQPSVPFLSRSAGDRARRLLLICFAALVADRRWDDKNH